MNGINWLTVHGSWHLHENHGFPKVWDQCPIQKPVSFKCWNKVTIKKNVFLQVWEQCPGQQIVPYALEQSPGLKLVFPRDLEQGPGPRPDYTWVDSLKNGKRKRSEWYSMDHTS